MLHRLSHTEAHVLVEGGEIPDFCERFFRLLGRLAF